MTYKVFGWMRSAVAIGSGLLGVVLGRGWRRCCLCGHRVPAFLPWRGGAAAAPPLLRALRLVGSDLDHFACPRCGGTDRERHLRLYLEASGMAAGFDGARVLHFAPEAHLAPWIGSLGPAEHLLADLYPARPGIQRMDLEALPFPEARFDWVIVNHVLEHVADLDAALGEIGRVLVDDGRALLQVPWCAGLSRTIEDADVTTPEARLQLYGQEDHVRLFGRDVFEQLARHGLRATPAWHAGLLAHVDPDRAGVNPAEPFMVFVRTPRGHPLA